VNREISKRRVEQIFCHVRLVFYENRVKIIHLRKEGGARGKESRQEETRKKEEKVISS
jgi:hypothetical protein